jgi:spore coat protein U-like protein
VAKIALGQGLHAGNAVGTSRAMAAASGAYLSYELYTDASRSVPWVNLTTVPYTSLTKNNTQTLTVYGRIPAGQNVPAQSYSDSVTITASF